MNATRGDPPFAAQTGSRIQYLSGAACRSAASGTLPRRAETVRSSKANPSRTQARDAFDAARADRTNDFLASVIDIDFDWLPAAQAAKDCRADYLWRLLHGRQPADLITLWLSTGLLPDDACQKINERIAKALGAHAKRGVSLATLNRDIDGLTDALTKLFEEAQGDLDVLHVAIAAAIKDCVALHAYRLRRSKGDTGDERSCWPLHTLRQTKLVIFVRIGLHETLRSRYVASLDHKVCATIEQCRVVTWPVF
jgi:hypothetical protein